MTASCELVSVGATLPLVKRKRMNRVMRFFAGMDVSIEETAICMVGDDEKVVLETVVATEPALIADALAPYAGRLRRAGHEAGSLSPWLHIGLLEIGVPAECLEA